MGMEATSLTGSIVPISMLVLDGRVLLNTLINFQGRPRCAVSVFSDAPVESRAVYASSDAKYSSSNRWAKR
jgi:hypothetical protein